MNNRKQQNQYSLLAELLIKSKSPEMNKPDFGVKSGLPLSFKQRLHFNFFVFSRQEMELCQVVRRYRPNFDALTKFEEPFPL